MKDRRLPPFVWQSHAAMEMVRHCFDGKERTTAVAIYQAMTTLANAERAEEFTASRREIAELSGTGIRTIDRYVETFERVGLIEVERRVDGGLHQPNHYVLADSSAATAPPPVQPPHQGGAATAPPSDVREEVQQEGGEENSTAARVAAGGEPQLFEAPPATTAKPADPLDALVQRVWEHYVQVFGDRLRVKELTPPRAKSIRKGLKAMGVESDPENAVTICCRAISGLKSYRQEHPDGNQDINVSVVFETGPHTKHNLTDWITRWADYAKETVPVPGAAVRVPIDLVGVPSVTKGTIQARRREVARMYDHPGSAEAKERGEVAVDWLREHVGHKPRIEDGQLRGWELIA